MIRHNWVLQELNALYNLPLLALVSQAHEMHRQFHPPSEVQICSIISIKTGGCPEDCKYCSQSSRYQTATIPEAFMTYDAVMDQAQKALARGASRICLVAAWREVRDSKQFQEVQRMTKDITALGAEVCCCLGMLKPHQAEQLKAAGAYAYNHNLDTSENYYPSITTTRNYQDRLNTLDVVEKAHLSVCCGGILGLGEALEDRLALLITLANRNIHPDSVPINRLSPIPGTPLENQPIVSIWEMIRMIALTRIVLPKAMVRLSSGRQEMSFEEQALCFLAGANSIHAGEKLLTISNHPIDKDAELFQVLGLTPRVAFANETCA